MAVDINRIQAMEYLYQNNLNTYNNCNIKYHCNNGRQRFPENRWSLPSCSLNSYIIPDFPLTWQDIIT